MKAFDIRRVPPEDLDALFAIRDIAYQDTSDPSDPEVRARHTQMLRYRWGCYQDGALISTASWLPFRMNFGARIVEQGGLASVATALQHRRKGSVAALLEFGLLHLHQRSIGWSLEYPFDTKFYHRYGWDTVDNGLLFELPTSRLRRRGHVTKMQRVSPADLDARERLKAIHARWSARYNFTLARDAHVRDTWTHLLEGVSYDRSPRFTFLGDHAYCVLRFTHEGGVERAIVLDWAYDAPEGHRALFDFLGTFDGQFQTVQIQLPSDDPGRCEWSNHIIAHPHPLHARVVDVEAALSGLVVPESLDVAVRVSDDFCPWNQGTFHVGSVGGFSVVETSEKTPRVHVDIRTLARLISGSLSATFALHAGLVLGDRDAVEALGALSGRTPYAPLADYF